MSALQVILASGSLQRKELLGRIGVEFEVRVSGVEEIVHGDPAEVVLANNLLVGGPQLAAEGHWTRRANFSADWDEFVQAAREDFRLRPGSRLRGKAQAAGEGGGLALRPTHEYRHPRSTVALAGGGPAAGAWSPGAFQG